MWVQVKNNKFLKLSARIEYFHLNISFNATLKCLSFQSCIEYNEYNYCFEHNRCTRHRIYCLGWLLARWSLSAQWLYCHEPVVLKRRPDPSCTFVLIQFWQKQGKKSKVYFSCMVHHSRSFSNRMEVFRPDIVAAWKPHLSGIQQYHLLFNGYIFYSLESIPNGLSVTFVFYATYHTIVQESATSDRLSTELLYLYSETCALWKL